MGLLKNDLLFIPGNGFIYYANLTLNQELQTLPYKTKEEGPDYQWNNIEDLPGLLKPIFSGSRWENKSMLKARTFICIADDLNQAEKEFLKNAFVYPSQLSRELILLNDSQILLFGYYGVQEAKSLNCSYCIITERSIRTYNVRVGEFKTQGIYPVHQPEQLKNQNFDLLFNHTEKDFPFKAATVINKKDILNLQLEIAKRVAGEKMKSEN